jgi:hypothetical protein
MSEPDENRIDQLDEQIQDAKEGLDEQTGETEERRFIDSGAADDETVDNTIVPPG